MTGEAAPPDEAAMRSLCEAGNYGAAATLALEKYGGEVFGYLIAVHRDQDEADDAYGMCMEKLLSTLPSFRWQCGMRSWMYLLARNASAELRRNGHRRRAQPLGSSQLSQLAEKVRTETLSLLRTEKRTALQELYTTLSVEDRELLVLRLTRELSWRDVALVMAEGPTDPEALGVLSARLRKRYQLLRDRLRKLGKERGLL